MDLRFEAGMPDGRTLDVCVDGPEGAVPLLHNGTPSSGRLYAPLVRTSLFLGVLSAADVALGFAAQAGVERTDFIAVAGMALLVVLFLGVTARGPSAHTTKRPAARR